MVVHHDHHCMVPSSFPPSGVCRVQSLWYLYNPVRFSSSLQHCSWLPHRIYTSWTLVPSPVAQRAAGTDTDALFLVLNSACSHPTGWQGLFWQIPLRVLCLLPLLPVMGHGLCCYPPSTSPQLSINVFMKNTIICPSIFHSARIESLIKNIFRNCQRKGEKKTSFPVPSLGKKLSRWQEVLAMDIFYMLHA